MVSDIVVRLMGKGHSLDEALEIALCQKREADILKGEMVWTSQGDLKCPICRKYSKIYSSGYRTAQILRLHCKFHGILYKTPEHEYWRTIVEIRGDLVASK
jgi:hypothetical protein